MYPPRISSDRPKSLTLSIVSSAIFYSGRVKAWKIFRRNIANVNRLSRRQLHTVLHFLRIYSTLYCEFHPDIWWSPYYSFYIIESASAKRIKLNKVAERLTHDRIYQTEYCERADSPFTLQCPFVVVFVADLVQIRNRLLECFAIDDQAGNTFFRITNDIGGAEVIAVCNMN